MSLHRAVRAGMIGGFVVSTVAVSAVGEPVFVSQNRWIHADYLATVTSQTAQTFDAEISSPDGGYAEQQSNLSECGIFAWVNASGRTGSGAGARTVCDISFMVTEVTSFTLAVVTHNFYYSSPPVYPWFTFTLSGNGTIATATGNIDSQWTGVLEPGVQYLLHINAEGFSGGFSGFAASRGLVILQLGDDCTLPELICAADRSADGTVGVDDIGRIIADWNRSVPFGTRGDANYDGRVSLADIARVVAHWGETCVPQP